MYVGDNCRHDRYRSTNGCRYQHKRKTMKITVYGPSNCSNCTDLKETAEAIIDRNGIDANVTKETDMTELAAKGVMSTPGFEIDDEMIFSGTTPSEPELESIITEHV